MDRRRRRIFRALVALFPPAFRRERGADMERLYAELREEWARERGGAGPGFWLRVVWDATSQAAAAWMDSIRKARTTMTMTRTTGENMNILMKDLHFGLRQMLRRPLISVTVIVLVAVGIAGNAAVFRIFNGMFLRPLPFTAPQELVDLDVTAPQWDLEYVGVSIADFRAWERDNRTFQAMAAFTSGGANMAAEGSAQRVSFLSATHTLDDVLELTPDFGRFFTAEEDRPDAPWVGLLTHGFWERQFASEPDVVGSTVRLDGESVEIIGVLPAAAALVGEADLWLPLREDDQSSFYLEGIGRLRPGTTVRSARDDVTAIHKALAEERHVNEVTTPVIQSLRDRFLGPSRLGSGFLLAAVTIVLLIACANIAGLMFARSVARAGEVAVRRALGAGRGRIVRQLLTESLLLAFVGGALGVWLGVAGSERLLGLMGDQFPSWVTFDLDVSFLAFTVVATAGAALVFGLLPALHASKREWVAGGTERTTASAGARRGLSVLVGGEVAMAAALLVVAGLVVLDVRELGRADPGFRSEGLLTYRIQLSEAQYPEREDRLAFAESYVEGLGALPSVRNAALTSNLPLMGHSGWFFEVEGAPPREDGDNPVVLRRWATPGYFDVMGVTLVQGRAFDDFDGREEGSFVTVVNEAFVRSHIPEGTDPVGQRIRTGEGSPWYTIIGVTHDVKHYGTDEPMRPGVHEPIRQNPVASIHLAVRTGAETTAAMGSVRALTREMDPELAIYDVRAMEARYDEALLARRATSWLIGIFAAVAVLLAVAGLYGVISYSVSQRTREIGIRMAMGAPSVQVGRRIVRQGMAIAAVGVGVGLLAALAAGGVISGILVDVSATDPWVYGGVTVLLLAVAGLANWLPARRAAKMDPMATLRTE